MRDSISMFRTLDLPGGSVVPFPSMPGERVRVLYGRVWLTEEGGPGDAFLATGEEISLGTRGLAVIEAMGPARIQLYEDLQSPSWLLKSATAAARRVLNWLRRQTLQAPRQPFSA
jgi:hypothetical protein